MYGGVYVLTLALVGGDSSASRPGRFNPGERATGILCTSQEITLQLSVLKNIFHIFNLFCGLYKNGVSSLSIQLLLVG
jgi:hypothetical protein